LQGTWSFATLTPIERPAELAGKASLTDQEAADYAKRKIERDNRDRRDGGAAADVSRAYNDSFMILEREQPTRPRSSSIRLTGNFLR